MKFTPQEIIFSATTECNLHCKHCFVNRIPQKIDIQAALNFIESCTSSPQSQITKIGFSGGEPFLYMDFILQITRFAITKDLLFDQIMTNGDWWQTEEDLKMTLQQLYDAGYDGKIGLSWDSFHNQNPERMLVFIKTVQEIFGTDSINIQQVSDGGSLPLAANDAAKLLTFSATPSSGGTECSPATPPQIPVYTLQQSFPSSDSRAWTSKKWFKEDYCEGPGHILYIHANGNIAPCCGFANENKELFIGTINDTFETVMQNAQKSKMLAICYETGLSKYKKTLKKQLKKQGIKFPGKCGDICSFCDFVCRNLDS